MCGQVGIIFGNRRRSARELDYFKKVFTYLLLLSERRGPHAAGVSYFKCDGDYRILKRPGRALDLIRGDLFSDFLTGIDGGVAWLAGHTRWQTKGDASDNRNNHPILAGEIIGTHNGTIINADSLFARLGLPRQAEVDSELIFRMADATLTNGRIDITAFKAHLALCEGQVSAVLASRLDPQQAIIIKGNKPLEVRYNKRREVVVYSSDTSYLETALSFDKGWKPVCLDSMTVATFSYGNLQLVKREPFELAASVGTDYCLPEMEESL